jgi:hypothetical protein
VKPVGLRQKSFCARAFSSVRGSVRASYLQSARQPHPSRTCFRIQPAPGRRRACLRGRTSGAPAAPAGRRRGSVRTMDSPRADPRSRYLRGHRVARAMVQVPVETTAKGSSAPRRARCLRNERSNCGCRRARACRATPFGRSQTAVQPRSRYCIVVAGCSDPAFELGIGMLPSTETGAVLATAHIRLRNGALHNTP